MWTTIHDYLPAAESFFSSPVVVEIAKSLLAMAGIVIGGLIAIFAYFRQKEYELVKQRYLEGAVDVLVAHFTSMQTTVSNNYARCLQVLKSYRESDEFFETKELETGFLSPKEFSFEDTAHVRLQALIGSDVFWTAFLSATADFQSANTFFTFEVPQVLRIKLASPDKVKVDRKTLANETAEKALALHDSMLRFSPITAGLHVIAQVLERQKFSFKALSKVRDRPEIIEVIQKIEEHNASEIQKFEQKKAKRMGSPDPS